MNIGINNLTASKRATILCWTFFEKQVDIFSQ